MQGQQHDFAKIAKALSDDNRLRILTSLREGEKCACELFLCDAGLVVCRRDRRWAYYSTDAREIEAVAEAFRARFCPVEQAECTRCDGRV